MVRSQRSLPTKPPPISKSPPVSSQDSWHSHATSGLTVSGDIASRKFGGSTPSVMRDAATGAIALTWMPRLLPSMASVLEKPARPSLAIA